MEILGNADCRYSIEMIRAFQAAVISNYFSKDNMSFSITHAAQCMKQPTNVMLDNVSMF
jgi:hypothetical protein